VHLFAAYKVASNANFRQLAKEEEIKYERGEPMMARSLMGFMLSGWEIMKNKDGLARGATTHGNESRN
jgi:hypothetical protein